MSARPPKAELRQERYTSRDAARLSGVPFFTVDYWDRTKFLEPTVAKGDGRGRGRERKYSYADILRLRIARDLREQDVSLQSLRRILSRLARYGEQLIESHYVIVGKEVEGARTATELVTLLRRRGRRTFGVFLDLRDVLRDVETRAGKRSRSVHATV